MRIALNVAILYAAWFATVFAAAAGRPFLAAAASLAAVLVNVAIAPNRAAELRLVLQAAIVGLVFDAIVINSGLATYASPGPIESLPPFWLLTIWMAFATSLNVSLAWLKYRLVLAGLLATVVGPLSYYAGARLGAMEFSQPLWIPVVVLGALWALAFPLLLFLSRRNSR